MLVAIIFIYLFVCLDFQLPIEHLHLDNLLLIKTQ